MITSAKHTGTAHAQASQPARPTPPEVKGWPIVGALPHSRQLLATTWQHTLSSVGRIVLLLTEYDGASLLQDMMN